MTDKAGGETLIGVVMAALALWPWLSVAVQIALKVPPAVYVWLRVGPVPVVPSPKFQE